MGFHDLHSFNLAMLSKQAWRLIHDTNSLFYKEYKARYFQNSSFMIADVGSHPSFVWRSLLAAGDIIFRSSKWRVGNDTTIGVYNHKWLTHTPIPLTEAALDMRVCKLIDEDTRQWDRGKLEAIFSQRTWEDILTIPLNHLQSQDTLIWTENAAQKFSVKTAYRVALHTSTQTWAEHSAVRGDGPTWNKVWTLKVPLKVRMLLWRACSNCLPTRDKLHQCRVSVDTRCDICLQQPETAHHILWECPFAQNMWALFRGRTQKCSNKASDFFILFRQMQGKLSQQELEKWAVTASAIWTAMKNFYFQHYQTHPKVIAEMACGLLEEYQRFIDTQGQN